MKEGIYSAEIVPSVDHLDYFGPAKEHGSTEENQVLKGHIRLQLTKALKVKSISVKFKGETIIRHVRVGEKHLTEVSTALLPKLKTRIQQKPTLLNMGEYILPWELVIPNIYPRSLCSKRGVIQYKVEMKMTLGINKAVSVSSPIIIRRHMLPSQDSAPNVSTNKYENTVPEQFHYEIEAPKVICIEQGYMPVSIRYKCYNHAPVKLIFTQFIQAEIYRNRSLSKAEADLAVVASKKNSTIVGQQLYKSYKNGDIALSKFFKRIQPVTVNTIDNSGEQDYILMPLLIKHDLDPSLLQNTESPLVTIHHQLEITFNFGPEHDEIRAKVPVVISTIPDSDIVDQINSYGNPESKASQKYNMETHQDYRLPLLVEVLDSGDSSINQKRSDESYRSAIMNDSTISTHSTISNLKENHPLARMDANKPLKKATSDQNMRRGRSASQRSMGATSLYGKRRSVTPPPHSSSAPRPTSILQYDQMIPPNSANTYTFNHDNNSKPLDAKTVYNYTSSTTDITAQSPVNSFVGLPPPPRRTRKKEIMATDNKGLSRTLTSSSSSSTSSRPTSPSSNYYAPSVVTPGILQLSEPFMPLPSVPDVNTPLSPRSNKRNILNQSKSTSTASSSSASSSFYYQGSMMTQARADSIDGLCSSTSSLTIQEDFCGTSIKNHFVGAELPPIPPARQRLPSVSQGNSEHRRTRLYYEDDSDEEDDLDHYDLIYDE